MENEESMVDETFHGALLARCMIYLCFSIAEAVVPLLASPPTPFSLSLILRFRPAFSFLPSLSAPLAPYCPCCNTLIQTLKATAVDSRLAAANHNAAHTCALRISIPQSTPYSPACTVVPQNRSDLMQTIRQRSHLCGHPGGFTMADWRLGRDASLTHFTRPFIFIQR